ncbi:uncharacterized protein [Nicotiana sylvestris]|uniref:uncharacterized protein n=1 Tax=Nicotiana sylvestris TaxID=4096 RepID=UPI00388C9298
MGGRGRPRKNNTKTPAMDQKLTAESTCVQGKGKAKSKEKTQEKELDPDSDVGNWQDLGNYRNQTTTHVSSSKTLPSMENSNKGNNVMRIVSETPISSVVQTNGIVQASPSKEQRANPVDNYKDSEVVVQLIDEDIEEENLKWTRAVILYMVGNTLSTGAIERFITNQWANVQKPKFPNLPLNLWSNQALSKIGSGLGKPLYADACTTIVERISYARVLIEIDVTKPLPEKIKLYDPKGKKCCQLGHTCKDQRKQKQDGMIQKTGEGMQKQEWRKVRVLEPAADKIDAQRREKKVGIGNAFKALVDTAEKIVQPSEAQGEKEKQNMKVDYTLIRPHEQFILGKVTIMQQNINFYHCAVYVGDFNTILTSEDRYNDILVQEVETRDFKQFLLDAKVDELKTMGRQYTWTNNHVHSRIDRILVNAE